VSPWPHKNLPPALLCLIAAALFGAVPSDQVRHVLFQDDFSQAAPNAWRLNAGGRGKAVIADGRLVLDLTAPTAGKWAVAQLSKGIRLPATIRWEQYLAHDSPHTWFAGIQLISANVGSREQIVAGAGGSGLGRAFFLGRTKGVEGRVPEGEWRRFVLVLEKDRQALRVYSARTGALVEKLKDWSPLVHGPFVVRFFQNDARLGPRSPDTYAQDRGCTWFDNLEIRARSVEPAKLKPATTTHPYKIPLVFNRRMRWVTAADGLSAGSIAWETGRKLPLTGAGAASRWLYLEPWRELAPGHWPKQSHIQPRSDGSTGFTLPAGKNTAVFVLRAFQFNVEQHQVLHWEGDSINANWRLEVTASDGAHPFLWSLRKTPLQSPGPGHGTIDLANAYRESGRPNRYAEVDIQVRLQRNGPDTTKPASLRLKLSMPTRSAIVPRAPVVASVASARQKGVLLEAVIVDTRGRIASDPGVTLEAVAATVPGAPKGPIPFDPPSGPAGIRRARLSDLPPGEFTFRLTAHDARKKTLARTDLNVVVTAIPFADHYEREKRSYCTAAGQAVGPLCGDLLAWVPFARNRNGDRTLIRGAAEFERLIKREKRSLFITKWRALPRPTLDRYIDYMAQSGVRVIRLTPNVSPSEYYLDACGHLAPHGLEQTAFILAAARRNRIRVVINLFHYPYLSASTGRSPPVWQYFEAGFSLSTKWTDPRMARRQRSYIAEFLGFTGRDPAVMAYSIMGENDQFYPPGWINSLSGFIRRRAPGQMLVLEQGGNILNCRGRDPATYGQYRPARLGGVGYRAYSTLRHPTDLFLAVAARFFDTAPPAYLGEVACGVKTAPRFVTKYRDAMGIALTLQQPMAIAWSAAMVEGQCKVFAEVARRIDWSRFRRVRAPVAVVVDKPDREQVRRLVACEELLSSVPVDCEYVRPDAPRTPYTAVLDARRGPIPAGIADLPPAVTEASPIRLSPGNHCSYAASSDGRFLIAYVRNALHYETGICDIRSVERYRLADRPRRVRTVLSRMDDGLVCDVFDAANARLLRTLAFSGSTQFTLAETAADLVLFVHPAKKLPPKGRGTETPPVQRTKHTR